MNHLYFRVTSVTIKIRVLTHPVFYLLSEENPDIRMLCAYVNRK